MAIAQSDEQCRAIVSQVIGTSHEECIAEGREHHTFSRIPRESAFPETLASLQTGGYQSHGEHCEIHTRSARPAHHFLAIDGQVVAQHAEAESEEHHVHRQQPSVSQEKAVEAD